MSLDFNMLFKKKEGTDVVLKCVNRQIKAHRCILSARSGVFAAMFRSDMRESQKGIVAIKDMNPKTLKRMLRYIYCGKVKLTVQTAIELYKAADQYGTESLKDRCVSYLEKTLSQISACDVLLLAYTYSDEQLEKSAMDFMVENCALLLTDQWNKFCEEHPSLGNKVYRKYAYKHVQCTASNETCIPSTYPSLKSCDLVQPTSGFGVPAIQRTSGLEGQAFQPTSGFVGQPVQPTRGFKRRPARSTSGSKRVPTVAAGAAYKTLSIKSVSETESKTVEEKNPPSLEKMSLDFGKLFDNELESDVVLKCVDRQIKAHRCILSARSDVFAAKLTSNMMENKEVVVTKGVAPETFERMLRYIYSGKVEELTVETASELYKAADAYKIGSLKKRCASFLTENLSQIFACDVPHLADTYSDEQREKSAMVFMGKNSVLFCTDQWHKFCEENPSVGIAMYRKYVDMHQQSSSGLIFK